MAIEGNEEEDEAAGWGFAVFLQESTRISCRLGGSRGYSLPR